MPWHSFNTMQTFCLIIVKRKRHKTREVVGKKWEEKTENNASVQAGHAGLTRLARAIVLALFVLIVIQGININFQVNSIETISLH